MAPNTTGKVLGVGGVFFKTPDLEGLRAWYVRVLKLELESWGAFFPPLPAGGTVWSPFGLDSDHFKPSDAPFMINFVVDDLDGVLAHVRSEGVKVLSDQTMEGMGRFASILDPMGVKVELWQPEPEGDQSSAGSQTPEALDVSQA